MILYFVMMLGQAPQIFEIFFVSLHQVFVVKDHVDFFEHPSFNSYQSRKGHNPGFALARANTPQLLFRPSSEAYAVLSETELFIVWLVHSFVNN
jgi:hypothetical protein